MRNSFVFQKQRIERQTVKQNFKIFQSDSIRNDPNNKTLWITINIELKSVIFSEQKSSYEHEK